MNKIGIIFSVIAGLLVIISGVFFIKNNPIIVTYVSDSFHDASENIAAVFFKESITVAELNQKYKKANTTRNKVNVLVVPGHEPNFGGAEFAGMKERDMVVTLSNYLVEFLNNNKHYNTTITRSADDWNPIFSNYFATEWPNIIDFVDKQKAEMKKMIDVGLVSSVSGAYHKDAKPDVALRLYGINKWANENNIDISIHVHFNDYPRKNVSLPGKYSGLNIYVPERQYSNGTTTKVIATSVLNRLAKYNAISNLVTESAGVVEDQDLIAIGSNNHSDAASMLIEYGYIYEPQFQDPAILDAIMKDLAYQTYLGLEDFFWQQTTFPGAYDTLTLPYTWQQNIAKTKSNLPSKDVFALQSALMASGEYPVPSKTKNDCPRSGVFGPCTVGAIGAFQEKYDIKGETGYVGIKTREVLNTLFGS
jgi:N-acetylmuramoyl-L-alanine amidase